MKGIAVGEMPKMKPSVRLEADILPEIKNWKVGSEYTLVVKVRQTEMEENMYDKKKSLSARFEILKVTPFEKHMAKSAPKDPESLAKAVKRKVESY